MAADKTPEYETLLRNLARDLAPAIENAAKAAVADASPVVAVVADPIIDWIDAYIMGLIGTPVPASTTVEPLTLETVAKHVAALTVATGHATSSAMPAAKLATQTAPLPVTTETVPANELN
jgi:hypothetical protein